MSKVTICGEAVVITSSLKLEDIELIQKYRPQELTLMGGEDGKDPVFAIGTADCGSINAIGASFNKAANDGSGKASITLICKGGEEVKEVIADKLGGAIIALNKLEEKLPAVLEEIWAEKAKVMESIEVLA